MKQLVVNAGVDITDPSTLTPELFAGVTQMVICVGSIYGKLPPKPLQPGELAADEKDVYGYVDGRVSHPIHPQHTPSTPPIHPLYIPDTTLIHP